MRLFILAATACLICALPPRASACEPPRGTVEDPATMRKVIGLSRSVEALTTPSVEGIPAFRLNVLTPYPVICEEDAFLRIDGRELGTGYVQVSGVVEWSTRMMVTRSQVAFMDDRPAIVAWADEETLFDFMDTGDRKRFGPSFEEDQEFIIRSREFPSFPVLDIFSHSFRGLLEKRVFKVLLPILADTVSSSGSDTDHMKIRHPGNFGRHFVIREGYMIENTDLMEPVVEMHEDTLTNLISLYAVLATGGIDADGYELAKRETLGVFRGPVSKTVSRAMVAKNSFLGVFGLTRREFEELTSLQLLEVIKRIQSIGDELYSFYDANVEFLDTDDVLRVPVDLFE